MDSDLMGEGYFKPAISIEIKGEGVDIKRSALRLNGDGDTHYRFQESEEGVIDKFSFDAFVIKGKLEFSIHTWLSNGKHLDLVSAKDLSIGDTFKQTVKVEKDGKSLELDVSIAYFEA